MRGWVEKRRVRMEERGRGRRKERERGKRKERGRGTGWRREEEVDGREEKIGVEDWKRGEVEKRGREGEGERAVGGKEGEIRET